MTISFDAAAFQNMITNFAKTISRTPVTKTTSNLTGDETLTEGASADISGAFFRKEDAYKLGNFGLLEGADAVLLVLPTVTINKDDKLTYDSVDYRVDDVITRRLGTTSFYKAARCFAI